MSPDQKIGREFAVCIDESPKFQILGVDSEKLQDHLSTRECDVRTIADENQVEHSGI